MVPATIEMTLAVLFQHTVRGVFIYYLFIFTVLSMQHKYSITEPHTPQPCSIFFIIVNFLLYVTYQFNFIMDYRFRKKQILFKVWSRSWLSPSTRWILKIELRSSGLTTSTFLCRCYDEILSFVF